MTRSRRPTTTNGMDSGNGPFEVPDFWRAPAFSLPVAPGETLFTDTRFGEHDALPVT